MEAGEFFRKRTREARQSVWTFSDAVLASPDVVDELGATSKSRCFYCTQLLLPPLPAHVEQFRPPQDAVGLEGEVSRSHYWWLAYSWDNLFLACAGCKEAKGAKFPVADRRFGPDENLENESRLLLNPFVEDPEQHLVYLETGEVASLDIRGVSTIAICSLNRPDLVYSRDRALAAARVEIGAARRALDWEEPEDLASTLFGLLDHSQAFAPLRRQFANQWIQTRPRKILTLLSEVDLDDALVRLIGGLGRVTGRVMEAVAGGLFEEDRDAAPAGIADATLPYLLEAGRLQDWSEAPAPQASRSISYLRQALDGPHSAAGLATVIRVEIKNFRGIERLSLALSTDSGAGAWTTLLGENGVGKSSVLQAIALACAGPDLIRALDLQPARLLRQGSRSGFVRVAYAGTRRRSELRFNESDIIGSDRPGPALAAYGSTRLLSRSTLSSRDHAAPAISIGNLFDPFVPIVDPGDWLPDLSEAAFDAAARALKRLLVLDDVSEIARDSDGRLRLVQGRHRFELEDLSDGYKAMAALALDLMRIFLGRWGSLEAAEGLVLLDELGAHLHPRWQMRVTGALRAAFPRLQFVTTTHDPLCLKGLRDGEVVVLKRRPAGTTYAITDLPPVEGLAVDQLLTDEHFGLSSTIDPAIESAFDDYYELLAVRDKSSDDIARIAELKAELASYRQFGVTERERMALEAADRYLATARTVGTASERDRLKAETRKQIEAIWGDLSS